MTLLDILETRRSRLLRDWHNRKPLTGYNTARELNRLEKRIAGLKRTCKQRRYGVE